MLTIHSRIGLLAAAALALGLCGCGPEAVSVENYKTRQVTFPNGKVIRADVRVDPQDLARGMKYRESLAPDRGMLFMHGQEDTYHYWMYEVKIPLDIVWMDRNRKVVQIVHEAPPCAGPPEKCPVFGGTARSKYVLEVAAGVIEKNNVKPGMVLEF